VFLFTRTCLSQAIIHRHGEQGKMATIRHHPDAKRMIDAYIANSAPFAQPICRKLRTTILRAQPEIVEDWKWGPNYCCNGMVCGFGAFKQHVTLTFFRGDAMKDTKKLFVAGESNKHNRNIKFSDVNEFDEKTLTAYINEAVRINVKGIAIKERTIVLPADFKGALRKKKLLETYDTMSYTNRKEFAQWILGAKKEETRQSRIERAVKLIARGESLS
jgi:hypothetical protein